MSTFRLAFWIVFGMAVAFVAVVAVAVWLQLGKGGSEQAIATVVRLETSRLRSGNGSYRTTYCPVIAFTTRRGEQVEIASQTCTTPSAYEVGETLSVDYDPADPHNAAFGGFFTRWLITLVFGIFAAIFIGLSVLFHVLAQRGRRVP
ncbi:DUF3592 domain-containing protein [Oleomonas cavernae]|uniref:DUF3592 domain-containing protein n=1 Tax=Oleomonas cavernae TaxID=2320859 RepID=A0A418WFV2_9PROT|nr:DUF3592 domain-containing protein [Oleomonas cavernae]RJF88799.1 DUF3592 domain-containing protein [Oleomonas cavernae]